jgi:hypothetical protein
MTTWIEQKAAERAESQRLGRERIKQKQPEYQKAFRQRRREKMERMEAALREIHDLGPAVLHGWAAEARRIAASALEGR